MFYEVLSKLLKNKVLGVLALTASCSAIYTAATYCGAKRCDNDDVEYSSSGVLGLARVYMNTFAGVSVVNFSYYYPNYAVVNAGRHDVPIVGYLKTFENIVQTACRVFQPDIYTLFGIMGTFGIIEAMRDLYGLFKFGQRRPSLTRLLAQPQLAYVPPQEFYRRKAEIGNIFSYLSLLIAYDSGLWVSWKQAPITLLYLCLGHMVKHAYFTLSMNLNPLSQISRELAKVQRINKRNEELIEKLRQQVRLLTSFDYIEVDDDTPEEYICPVSLGIMLDPVTAPDKKVYDRQSLQAWYDHGGETCPLIPSIALTAPEELVSCAALKKEIRAYLSNRDNSQKPWSVVDMRSMFASKNKSEVFHASRWDLL